MSHLNTRYEFTISPRLMNLRAEIMEFQDIIRKYEAKFAADHGGRCANEMKRIYEIAENLGDTWKREVVEQLNDQLKDSEFLRGMICVKEFP